MWRDGDHHGNGMEWFSEGLRNDLFRSDFGCTEMSGW